jgi:cytochrome b561
VILVDTGWQVRALMGDLAPRTAMLGLHASLGILVLALLAARVLARLLTQRPAAPPNGRLWRVSAAVVQVALYLTLFAIVATGIVAAAPRPFMPAVQLFGVWPLPKVTGLPPQLMRNMPGIHATLVWVLPDHGDSERSRLRQSAAPRPELTGMKGLLETIACHCGAEEIIAGTTK